jgi:hypothetical protein
MDNLDVKPNIQPDENDLRAEFDALRHLVVSILILLIVVSGTFTVYLLRQWRTTSRELAVLRPQAAQLIGVFQKEEAPWMQEVLRKFTDYGRTHPDYVPILAKYNLKPAAATGAPPVSASAPQPAPKK